jgi:hypothetical protein
MDGDVTRGIALMLCGCAMVEKVWVGVQKVAPTVGGEVPITPNRLAGTGDSAVASTIRKRDC